MVEYSGVLPLLLKEIRSESEDERITAFYNENGVDAVFEFVQNKKIVPFAAKTFAFLGLDKDFWSEKLEFFKSRNLKIIALLDKIYSTLHRHGVRKMFVTENFATLLCADGDLSLFASGDIDNYADISEKEKIYAAFDELGFERRERYAVKNQIAATFHPHDPEIGEKFYISVDFHPLARLKLPCFVNADDFVDWSRLSTYKETDITLPPADALAYICLLHISLHSFSRAPDIRLYLDIANVSKCGADYAKISEWCKRDATCKRAAAAAFLANRLLGISGLDTLIDLANIEDILTLVYDSKNNDLLYEPHGFKILKLEGACDDRRAINAFWHMLFPDRDWMRETYGSTGIVSHVKHFIRLV